MQITVDHVTLCGPELQPMRQTLAAAGLASEYGGPHANNVTHMALLGFEDGSYLELIAPFEGGRPQASPWGKLMTGNAGPGAWAIAAADVPAEVARLRALGIEASEPQAGSRSRPDGKLLQWTTASAGPGSPGAMLPFMIQDRTPRSWRVQPSASLRGSDLEGIAQVVLGVKDLDAATALFRRAYGWEAPLVEDHAEFEARILHFPATPVMLAAPLTANSWLTERSRIFGEIPAAFLLKTSAIENAARRFPIGERHPWFGRPLGWLALQQLPGIRLGVVQD